MNLLVFVLVFTGLSMLCLGMKRHVRQVAGDAVSPAIMRAIQGLGGALLAFSLVPARQLYGGAIGVAVWFGLLSIAALGVALLLTYRPRLLGLLGGAAILFALRRVFNGPP